MEIPFETDDTNLTDKRLIYDCKHVGCTKRFDSFKKMWLHYKQANHIKSSSRELWQKLSPHKRKLMHMRLDPHGEQYLCNKCGKTFSIEYNMRRHIKNDCGKRVRQKTKNSEVPKFKCAFCSIMFKRAFHYNTHLKKHFSIKKRKKKFRCILCSEHFATIADLQIHSAVHRGENPNQCSTCHKEFANPGSLKSHMLIHTGERPYQCSFCLKRFRQPIHLKRHNLVHTGERPYRCNSCGKQFAHKGNLTVHEQIHSDKTYVCQTCSKEFNKASNFKKHKLTHIKMLVHNQLW